MTGNIVHALGGVGIFLLGMILLTDGLRGLAGSVLRNVLGRFTKTPAAGVLTGAAMTAVLQSSSATTVTAVGFVSAGLIGFAQAIGIILGANIGTTVTGWLVAILGFKLELGEAVLPFVFLAATLRLFGGPRVALVGGAIAGFSLIFIGIDVMREAMDGLEGVVTPASFPGDGFWGRVQLVLIGALVTVVTQSSSAGVASALAALGAGAINLPQAAAMVIGMNVGTTFTAMLATLGGSVATRRTGWCHVLFNLLVGLLAFALLGPFTELAARWRQIADEQVLVVAFHTGFNVLGVALVLPFVERFARLVTVLVPEKGPRLTGHLDRSLLRVPEAAMDAVSVTITDISSELFRYLASRLNRTKPARGAVQRLEQIAQALREVQEYIDEIEKDPPGERGRERLASAVHALDHLNRLYYRLRQEERIAALSHDRRLTRLAGVLRRVVLDVSTRDDAEARTNRLNRLRRMLRRQHQVFRNGVISRAVRVPATQAEVLHRLDAMRWLHRAAHHVWRIEVHRARMSSNLPSASELHEAAVDALAD
ncbi:Na/Pi symporter [Primorskyibacter aestuariivivens]|uniref:Na/Pi cotransporter family protein n=1 Tax=Primorskyibacter aestuariivivens TaxID=1888912 RepID=UPI00230074B1|nr:Na/Pi symporter [Primorskyibacter aestuariivivens]MDA7429730.1 Na/Pi symporter [Primorskyibacter aestuariivivens]